MRITTWNCHHGVLDERCTLLGTLVPDICILQECYRPSVFDDRQLWLGAPESPNAKGIGIKVSFHIDYCFIPRDWAKDIRGVTVGGFHDWIAESDHMPVTVDIDRQWSTLDSK